MGSGRASNPSRTTRSHVAFLVVGLIACALLAVAAYAVIVQPPFAKPFLSAVGILGDDIDGSSAASPEKEGAFSGVADTVPTSSQEASEKAEWASAHTYPLVASYGDVDIHSCVSPADLTGILFHQASYDYALVMETQLREADYEKTAASRSMKINREQASGTWLDAEALHIWRTGDATAMDTSVDVGAAAGSAARAPVTGTVVLVRDYMLYDEVPDVEIHIQPDGHADLDCVMIHTTDPLCKAGDHVEGGLTELCRVRDIEKDLTDVQLSFFTPEGVGGNHIHVQLNDANYPDYRKKRLKGAVKVKDGS